MLFQNYEAARQIILRIFQSDIYQLSYLTI